MTSVEAPREVRRKTGNRWWPWLLVVCVAGGAVWLFPRVTKSAETPSATAKGPAPGRAGGRQVPVVAAAARRGDMPVYLNGLGSVTAFNTVTVRSRVDGELVNVAFTEGEFVKQGDLLAVIDPRPYDVQLSLAEAQKAHDEALLANARLDLERYKTLMA